MIRILIVDDSTICRDVLADILEREGDIEVVGEAASGEQALGRIETLAPDVITLDIQMPGMGGLATIDEIMRRSPRPILVVTGLDTRERDLAVEATRRGAHAVANKVSIDDGEGAASLRATVRSLAGSDFRAKRDEGAKAPTQGLAAPSEDVHAGASWPTPLAGDAVPILAFGCSAGGPKALSEILDALPRDLEACIAIANHLPADFAAPYARLLWSQHRFPVSVAESPTPPERGTIVLAPGGCHLVLREGAFVAEPAPSTSACPSVDRLFESIAASPGAHAGVILSGLGSDGARGLAAMRSAGQLTIAQSRESASVWGMPRAAASIAVEVLATQDIPRTLLRWLDLRAGA
jgi:two-component system chemotaxis response regulator CheB